MGPYYLRFHFLGATIVAAGCQSRNVVSRRIVLSRSKPLPRPRKPKDPSPTWYVTIMAGLMVLGVILVLLRFVFEWDQLVLIGGLAAIAAGFVMTTNYR